MMKNNTRHSDNVSLKKAFIMYIIVSMFLFLEMAIQVSPSVMTSQLMQAFHIGSLGLGMMSGCYFYSYTFMQLPSGFLFDKYKPRFVIIFSIFICVIGCLSLGMTNSIWLACFSRLLIGFGSAFAFVSVLVVTSDLFPAKYFATLAGVTQMLAALGAMSGQLPVHFLVDVLGWRNTLFTFSILGLLVITGVYFFLRYEKAIVLAGDASHNLIENVKSIIKDKQTWFIAVYACLLWTPMSSFASLWGVPFLEKTDSLSSGQAALVCSFMWLGLAFASPILGYVSSFMTSMKTGLVLSSCMGFLAFSCINCFHLPIIYLGILLFFCGAACSGQALSFALVKENNPHKMTASAIAINNMAVVISGALFQPLIGWLLHIVSHNKEHQYHIVSLVILLTYLIGLLIAMFFINAPNKYVIVSKSFPFLKKFIQKVA